MQLRFRASWTKLSHAVCFFLTIVSRADSPLTIAKRTTPVSSDIAASRIGAAMILENYVQAQDAIIESLLGEVAIVAPEAIAVVEQSLVLEPLLEALAEEEAFEVITSEEILLIKAEIEAEELIAAVAADLSTPTPTEMIVVPTIQAAPTIPALPAVPTIAPLPYVYHYYTHTNADGSTSTATAVECHMGSRACVPVLMPKFLVPVLVPVAAATDSPSA